MESALQTKAGLVIAGGRARRFGGDKALALLGGQPLLAHAQARLSRHCGRIAVNAPQDSAGAALAADLGLPVLNDPPGMADGPLAGVLAGLLWARARGADVLLTLPCDTPLVPEDLIERLAASMMARPCAVARTPDGVQSLCAAWSVSLIAPLTASLAEARHPPVHAFLAAQGCGFVDYAEATGFLNINTPQDLAEAERRWSATAP